MREEIERRKKEHESVKFLINKLAEFDTDPNPFKIMQLEMNIVEKLATITDSNLITKLNKEELLKREKSLLRILEVINTEVENNE